MSAETELKGNAEEVVREISRKKREPDWMLKMRLRSLSFFQSKPMPTWGPDLSGLDLENLAYYVSPEERPSDSYEVEDLSPPLREALKRIKPEEEKQLDGSGLMFQSEVIYDRLKASLQEKGIVFMSMDEAVQKYPDVIREYFMTRAVPPSYHKFAALNGAMWSGGTFLYVPKGVRLKQPIQVYYVFDHKSMGQFEHTVIIADEGSELQYIEACWSPNRKGSSLHAGAVEVFVKRGAHVRAITVQQWGKDVYNLGTKRAIVEEGGQMEWVEASLGSKVTMVYPATVLSGRGSKGQTLHASLASEGQVIDAGAKLAHAAPDTHSYALSKSVSASNGRAIYRGQVRVNPGAFGSSSYVSCDSLLVSDESSTATYPIEEVYEPDADVSHEASVGKISEEQVFYLMSRGISEQESRGLIVRGFMEPLTKMLPFEYAAEFNNLISAELKGF